MRLGGTQACWLWTVLSVVTIEQSIILGFDDRSAVVFQALMHVQRSNLEHSVTPDSVPDCFFLQAIREQQSHCFSEAAAVSRAAKGARAI